MKCWDKGLYVRYGGDVLTLAPPFVAEKSDIDFAVNVLADVISSMH
jgi:beta-alanine--pyruvate transaminase